MERHRRHRSRQSGTGAQEKEFVIVTLAEEWEQASQMRQLLSSHQVPVRIKEHQGFGDEPCWAVMVPEEYLDEAHVIIESETSYDDLYDLDGDEDQADGFEDIFEDQ